MECQSIDRVWPNLELCWALEPTLGNVVHGPSSSFSLGVSALTHAWQHVVLWCAVGALGESWRMSSGQEHRTETMGPIGAKGIAAPEVKFLDRRRTNCSEGVLQVRVRRSRMRVWGAKMIRHRRSPAP